jgi:hypothetical protein
MKYQAFISYKHSDISREKAISVEKALKKYAKPWWKPTNIKIFRDEKEMQPGDNLGTAINYALENSEYLLYFASKEAAQSEWVQKELFKWCGELQRADKLVIIWIADNIVTDAKEEKIVWEKTDALPSFLKDYINYIPIYEDLRWTSQDEILDLENLRFRDIINRIKAHFQGKTPAEMNDENVLIDRRNKRIKNLTIGILTGLFILSIITTWIAIVQKNRADEQYRKAVCNRLASESGLILPTDNVKAIRIAEAAYKISKPSPPAVVVRALSATAYSTRERPFYTASLNHEGEIQTAVFSPDGSKILTASDDETVKLWDLTGKRLADVKEHKDYVTSAVFSPDSSKILAVSDDKTAKLWDLQGHTGELNSAVFSPDGKWILTASYDGTAIIWPTPEADKSCCFFPRFGLPEYYRTIATPGDNIFSLINKCNLIYGKLMLIKNSYYFTCLYIPQFYIIIPST